MKTRFLTTRWFGSSLTLLSCWLLLLTRAGAATVLSGNVFGTWTTSGSPYIVSNDCYVDVGQTLTIQPGVDVMIGPNVTLFVYGSITAVGTPEQPIEIQGTGSTSPWNKIEMFYEPRSVLTNRFHHC